MRIVKIYTKKNMSLETEKFLLEQQIDFLRVTTNSKSRVMTRLSLSGRPLCSLSCDILIQYLQSPPFRYIKILNISQCLLGDDLKSIMQGLKNTNVEKLDISDNEIFNDTQFNEIINALLLTKITDISLSLWQLRDDNLDTLIQHLNRNKKIVSIVLDDSLNLATDSGIKKFLKRLPNTVKFLSLKGINLSNEVLIELVKRSILNGINIVFDSKESDAYLINILKVLRNFSERAYQACENVFHCLLKQKSGSNSISRLSTNHLFERMLIPIIFSFIGRHTNFSLDMTKKIELVIRNLDTTNIEDTYVEICYLCNQPIPSGWKSSISSNIASWSSQSPSQHQVNQIESKSCLDSPSSS